MDAEVGLGVKHQRGKPRASEWGRWEQSARGTGERVAPGRGDEVMPPLPHSPVSGVAQPLPVWSPGHRTGSSAPPVLEGDLRAQGEKEPGRVKASSAPLLPSAQSAVPSLPVLAVCHHPTVGSSRDPELPHAHCPALLPTSTHHLPHPILALHLGPQLHEALLHALVEGPQILRHLLSVDPDSL